MASLVHSVLGDYAVVYNDIKTYMKTHRNLQNLSITHLSKQHVHESGARAFYYITHFLR